MKVLSTLLSDKYELLVTSTGLDWETHKERKGRGRRNCILWDTGKTIYEVEMLILSGDVNRN